MSNTPYFPPLYGKVDCSQCEIAAQCWCCGKYQRDRRDFSHTSGRCPRLPDRRGFVDEGERTLYAQTFPLVHAERGEDVLHLTLTIPGKKRSKKIYQTKSGYWYFHERGDSGVSVKRVLDIQCYSSKDAILQEMDLLQTDYCLFRARIEDYTV